MRSSRTCYLKFLPQSHTRNTRPPHIKNSRILPEILKLSRLPEVHRQADHSCGRQPKYLWHAESSKVIDALDGAPQQPTEQIQSYILALIQ